MVLRLATAALLFLWLASVGNFARAETADVILYGGKVVTVDRQFSIAQAIAIRGERIVRVGSDQEVLALRGEQTRVVDLAGKLVLPGLIDSHVHPESAAMHEFDHEIPVMESIGDVLAYVKARAEMLGPGKWIVLRQVFITRLREQRYPTRGELDVAAPQNPVLFSTGPDASVNSLALKESGIDKDFRTTGSGFIERDPDTGEPTGILRNCTNHVKYQSPERQATEADRTARLKVLLADYNSVGITGIIDRGAGEESVARYARLKDDHALTVRVAASRNIDANAPLKQVKERLAVIAADPSRQGDGMLRVIGVKTFLDGGMLTGSAYMREPWGLSKIYSITDPRYRGVLMIQPEQLQAVVQATVDSGLQFTAHSVGDGAVHALLDAYEAVNKQTPIAKTRPCLTHSNFMSKEAIEQLVRLGVVVDIQPAWLYLDSHTLVAQFGYDRLRYFQPLASIFAAGGIVGGGSDHMQKVGSLRSVNPYDPFLAMWVTITRGSKQYDRPLHPEEALTRQQAIRFYTANNAFLMFQEDQIGTLEAGKLADLIVLDTDLLECPVDKIRDAKVLSTWLGGKIVYEKR